MAHFAEIDENNIVVRVLVVDDINAENGQDFLANELGLGGTWIQTSYNTKSNEHLLGGTPLRGNYAGIGYTYNAELDMFLSPKPFESWTLNESIAGWDPPVSMPTDGKMYEWVEANLAWEEVTPPTE